MKLANIIAEIEYITYEGMVRVIYEDETSNTIGVILRALPGVTTVTHAYSAGEGEDNYKVKVISQKSATEAFEALKKNALDRYEPIKKVEIDENTIEEK